MIRRALVPAEPGQAPDVMPDRLRLSGCSAPAAAVMYSGPTPLVITWKASRRWKWRCSNAAPTPRSGVGVRSGVQAARAIDSPEVRMQSTTTYPVQFSVDYPDRPLNRVTTAFRIFVVIPIAIVLGAVSGGTWQWTSDSGTREVAAGAGGLIVFAPLLMILFRRKYPRWWFDWNLELQRFSSRVGAYLALMNDRYPPTDDPQSVHLDYRYPAVHRDL